MAILDLLIKAIRDRKPVSFEYNKPNKTPGQRIGNAHAVFILTSKAGQISTKVHIVQTAAFQIQLMRNPSRILGCLISRT